MATEGSTFRKFHKCKGNTAHQMELFVIRIFNRWRDGMQQRGSLEGGKGGSYTPKCLGQFLTVLLGTFTTGLIFARQLKQGATTLCFDHNYI